MRHAQQQQPDADAQSSRSLYVIRRQSSVALLQDSSLSQYNRNGSRYDGSGSAYSGAGSDYDFYRRNRQSKYRKGFCRPFYWIYARLFLDLRDEDDDFETILRKIVISVGIPLVLFPIAFAMYMANEIANTSLTLGGLITLVDMLLFPLVWIPSYLYVRHTRELPMLLIDMWLIVTTLGIGVLAVALIEYPTPQLAFFLLIMAMLCRTPRLPLHILLAAGVYAVGMLNQAFSGLRETPAYDLAAVPEPYRGTERERIAYQVTGFVIAGFIAAAVIMQTHENARMMHKAANAATVARQVANMLATYDTETAKDELAGFARAGETDPDLVFAFYAIVENLELYRPHLPHWIMQAHEEEREHARMHADRGEDVIPFEFLRRSGEESPSESPPLSPNSARYRVRGIHQAAAEHGRTASGDMKPIDIGGAAVDIEVQSVSESPHSGTITPPMTGPERDLPPAVAPARSTSQKDPRRGSNGMLPHTTSGVGMGGRTPTVSALLSAATQRPYHGKATFAFLHLTSKLTTPEMLSMTYDSMLEQVCDRLHEVAHDTAGVIHHVAGDSILMSWNAVQRTAAFETKCAKALAQLGLWSGHINAKITGAAITDVVRCHHYGTSQKLFGAFLPFRHALWALSLYARDREALVVDEVAYRAGQSDVEMIPSDVVKVVEWRRGVADMHSPHSGSTTHSPHASAAAHRGTNLRFSPVPSVNGSPQTSPFGPSTVNANDGTRHMMVFDVLRDMSNGNDVFSEEPNTSTQQTTTNDDWMFVRKRNGGRMRRGSTGSADHSEAAGAESLEQALRIASQGRFREAHDIVHDFHSHLLSAAAKSPGGQLSPALGSPNAATHDPPPTGGSGSSGKSDPKTHAHAASPDNLAININGSGDSSAFAGVPRAITRLLSRLELLIASRAGTDEFSTTCILSYSGNAPHSAAAAPASLLGPSSLNTSTQH